MNTTQKENGEAKMKYIEESWKVEKDGKLSFTGCDLATGKIREIGRVFKTSTPRVIKALRHNWDDEFGGKEEVFPSNQWPQAMLWIENK